MREDRPVIDREARDKMADVLERLLRREITGFQCDDALFAIGTGTIDQTVQYFHSVLALDDAVCFEDRPVRFSKELWDYLGRIVLVLRSDAHLEITEERRPWNLRQTVAVCSLAVFVYLILQYGPTISYFLGIVPFFMVAIVVRYWNQRSKLEEFSLNWIALNPFSTVYEILSLRKKTPAFVKIKYPECLKKQQPGRIERFADTVLDYFLIAMYCSVLWPLVLCILAFPWKEEKTSILLPGGR